MCLCTALGKCERKRTQQLTIAQPIANYQTELQDTLTQLYAVEAYCVWLKL